MSPVSRAFNLRLALTAGLCGGYSTLAAFAFENTMLLRSGHYFTTGAYILATLSAASSASWQAMPSPIPSPGAI